MTVAELINQIAAISFNDDNASSADRARILRYLNLANNKIFYKISQIASAFVSQTTTLSLTSGAVALPSDHYKTIKIIDTTNSAVLVPKEIEAIEDEDPALSATGNPRNYYIEGGNLKVYPSQDINIRMRYTPVVEPLVDEASEATILYPRPFHEVLIDGGLYYMFEDERDTRALQEIALADNKFNQGIAALVEYYRNESRQPQTVEYVDF